MDLIKMIVDWQKERLLDKQDFNKKVETLNILEELVEVNTGFKSKEARKKAEELYKVIENENKISKEEIADAFCDIIVYAVGAMLKAGIDPQCALNETLKEINSRVGEIKDGKFVKDTSDEAKAKWYKADYQKCFYNK